MNKCIFIGNVTNKPETRTTEAGMKVCSFGMALRKGKDGVTYIDCIAFKQTAELIEKYVEKGNKVGIIGEYDSRDYTDKEGNKRKFINIIVNEIELLTPKNPKEKEIPFDFPNS